MRRQFAKLYTESEDQNTCVTKGILENKFETTSDKKLRDESFLHILAATARRHTGRPLVNCGVRPGLTRGVRNR